MSDYQHPLWLKCAKEHREAVGNRCEECGCSNSLEAHHTYYRRGCKLWEIEAGQIRVLCRSCHDECDGLERESQKLLMLAYKKLGSEWLLNQYHSFVKAIELPSASESHTHKKPI